MTCWVSNFEWFWLGFCDIWTKNVARDVLGPGINTCVVFVIWYALCAVPLWYIKSSEKDEGAPGGLFVRGLKILSGFVIFLSEWF